MSTIIQSVLIDYLQQAASWYSCDRPQYMRSLFSYMGFRDKVAADKAYFLKPVSLSAQPNYPVADGSNSCLEAKQRVHKEIAAHYQGFSTAYLQSLNTNQLFYLMEKYGSYIPAAEDAFISLFDACKVHCAEAIIDANPAFYTTGGERILIHFDISGIQDFIYNITSSGALKNLRARSFFIELLTQHTISGILDAFQLHQANVLVNGGGCAYILAGKPGAANGSQSADVILEAIDLAVNGWLLAEFNGRLHITFAARACTRQELADNLAGVLSGLSGEAFKQKQRRFNLLLKTGQFPFQSALEPLPLHCAICWKECADPGEAAYITSNTENGDTQYLCAFCANLVQAGSLLADVRYIYPVKKKPNDLCLQIADTWYLLKTSAITGQAYQWIILEDSPHFLEAIRQQGTVLWQQSYITKIKDLLAGVRGKISRKEFDSNNSANMDDPGVPAEDSMAQLEHLAAVTENAPYIGALRMDADNMGKLLQKGFYNRHTLTRLVGFSRQVNHFFKLFLPYLCKGRQQQADGTELQRSIQLIYSGGDDLFLLGAWHDVLDAGLEIGQAFQEYTCCNIDIGLSGGFTVHPYKFPVSKMALLSRQALETAKSNLEPCWMCVSDFRHCPLYQAGTCLRKDSFAPFYTAWNAYQKQQMDSSLHKLKYRNEKSRLQLALKWKQQGVGSKHITNEVEQYYIMPFETFRKSNKTNLFFQKVLELLNTWYKDGVLYLPRIAWLLQKEKEGFTGGQEQYSVMRDVANFPTLHLPLNWIILYLKRGTEK